MSESIGQFSARTQATRHPIPAWASALLFLAVFLILQTGYDSCRGSDFEHFVISELIVTPSAALIKLLTPFVQVSALGNQLIAPDGGISVLKGCEGTEVMFMLVAAFSAVAIPWRRRLIGMALGIFLVFGLNQMRLLALFYAYRTDSDLFGLLHGMVAPIILILSVALFFTG